MTESAPRRGIRSFVIRAGRQTAAQQRALDELWPRFGIDWPPAALPLDPTAVFGRSAPLTVEIGFGDGANLAGLAARHPARNYLGIEVHPPGVGHLLLAIEAAELTNVRIVRHDAVEVLTTGIEKSSIDEILVLFPDPWPKKRHHKRRLIQPDFATLAASCLHPGGTLRLATDWQPYAEHMRSVLNDCALLTNSSREGDSIPRPDWRESTKFERRGQRLGHGVWDFEFMRRS